MYKDFFEKINENEEILFKVSEVDIDEILSKFAKDTNCGIYDDYEIFKNYSLSQESWIAFLDAKMKPDENSKEIIHKYFGIIVLQGYLCSFTELSDPNSLYLEPFLEDILTISLTKSLKFDFIQMQESLEHPEMEKHVHEHIHEHHEEIIHEKSNDIKEEKTSVNENGNSVSDNINQVKKPEVKDDIVNSKYLI